jgi:membrane protease YdiL (CAAX protease family)
LATTFSLAEEIGIRGYLLPKLLPLGRKRALLVSGLVWATWHMPLPRSRLQCTTARGV